MSVPERFEQQLVELPAEAVELARSCHRWHLEPAFEHHGVTVEAVAVAARLTIDEQRTRCAAMSADVRRHERALSMHVDAARAVVAAADGRLDL